MNAIMTRTPWHQYIDRSEGDDIFKVITRVTELAAVLQSYGIETDIPKINEKLKPEQGRTYENQIVMFKNLYYSDMNSDDDAETTSAPSNGQSRAELDALSGD